MLVEDIAENGCPGSAASDDKRGRNATTGRLDRVSCTALSETLEHRVFECATEWLMKLHGVFPEP
jgi:hypothetical protein